MTVRETERLAVVETKIKTLAGDISEVKGDVKSVIKKLDNLDNRYPTRREFAAANWAFGIVITVITVGIAILNSLK